MNYKGSIEVICGGMFAGKTDELQRRLKRAKIAKQDVIIFKPKKDDRYDNESICTHDGRKMPSINIQNSNDIISYLENKNMLNSNKQITIGIEEVQFLDDNLYEVVKFLRDKGFRVICSGLDMDFKGEAFDITGKLLCIANDIEKLKAICINCGDEAYISSKKIQDNDRYTVGGNDKYDAKCWYCDKNR